MLGIATYFSFIFKGKQNKKKSSKFDSLFEKYGMWKTKVGFAGQVTYQECTIKVQSTPLSP